MKKFLTDKVILILFGFILLGLFLRTYNFYQLFYYTMDEEVMNLIQRRIVLGEHLPLIGSVSPLSTYLGPYFYYIGAIILWISNLNPLGQGIFGAFLGTFNIFLIYFVTSRIFDKRVGLFAAIFYSTSFLMVIFDRRYWHLTPGPVLSLLVLYSLCKIKQGYMRYVYLLTGALIFGFNTDYTNLGLFLFTILAWVLFKLPVKKKEVIIALLIFLASNFPLVIFDLRHDFLNTKAFVTYFVNKSGVERDSSNLRHFSDRETLGNNRQQQALQAAILPLITFSRAIFTQSDLNISKQHTYCKPYIFERNKAQTLPWILMIVLILGLFFYLVWQKRSSNAGFPLKIVFSFYMIFQLGIFIYSFVFNGDVFEHYMATLLPVLFIILALVLNFVYERVSRIALFFIFIFVYLNLNLVINAYNPLGFENKIKATKYALEKVGQRDFSLDSLGSCFRYDGFYYPFLLFGRQPVKSYQDPNYSWLFNYEVARDHPERVVVMVSRGEYEDERFIQAYNRYQKWVLEKEKFEGLEVLILDNSKGEFQ